MKYNFTQANGRLNLTAATMPQLVSFAREHVARFKSAGKVPATILHEAQEAMNAEAHKLALSTHRTVLECMEFCAKHHEHKEFFLLGRLDPAPDADFADILTINGGR